MADQFKKDHSIPVTKQDFPGKQSEMPDPPPEDTNLPTDEGGKQPYLAAGKLKGKKAVITGGDSGIGRSTAILFAMEGADSLIVYLPEEEKDAQDTKREVEKQGQTCHLFATDLSKRENCKKAADEALRVFNGSIDILFNNAAYQMMVEDIQDLEEDQWVHTFNVNIHSFFYLSKYLIPHISTGGAIINNASINAYIGRPDLLDYTSTKGAIISFTRGLSNQYVSRGIRVNAIAPGPVWTPLIPSTMNDKAQKEFTAPMGRPAQPSEIATCVVFLASKDSSCVLGRTSLAYPHTSAGTWCGGSLSALWSGRLSSVDINAKPKLNCIAPLAKSSSVCVFEPVSMSVHADILHLAVAGAGVVIVAGLSVPSFIELSKRSKLFKSNGYGTVSGFYEDQDGEATEDSTQNYSDTWPRLLTWLSATLGLAASIVAGILANETDSFVSAAASFQSILSSWSDLAAWAFIFSQCVFLPRRGQYLAKYGLAIYGLLSAIVLTCSLVYRNKFAYLVTSHRDSRVLGLGICWLLQVAAAVAVAFSLAAIPRRPDVYFKGKLVDQQYTVSILSKMAFSWNDIVFQISKERQLEMTDLPRLDFVTRSRNLYTHFTARNDQGRLWWRLVKFHSVQLAQQWSLVLVSSLLALFPQYVLYNFLERLESPRIPGQGKTEIWAWALGLCFALGLQVVVNGLLSWWTTSRLMLPLGSVLQSLVFHKALNQHEVAAPAVKTEDDDESKDNNDPKSKPKDKEKKTDDIRQSVINHMKLDSGRVTMFCNFNYYFPLALVKLILAGGFLMKLLGWKAVVAGLLSAALVIPVSHWMSKKYAKIQFGLMKYRDGKAHLLTEALQGMRQIKYSALEQYWEDKILKSRNEELGQYWKVSLMMCLVILVINMGPLLLACVALSIYAFEQGPNIRASVIFASLGLFDQLDEAVALLPMLQVYLMEAWTSCVRLENYFNQPDKAPVAIEGEAITFEEATVAWPKAEEKEGEGEPQEERSMLRDITLEFPAGELSVITGKTGSGKSLLLAAILGEVKLLSGTVKVPTPPPEKDDEIDFIADAEWIIPSLTSFVSQTPWIETGTVKENITFGLPLSEVRYRKVLKACSLEKDIELLVDGDKTEVGPKGVTLSGGQRWRVALARALYSRAGVLILDDVLSAVDAHVGRIIVDEALTGELARGRTRILATHHAEMVLPRSSYLVRLHDGKVENAEAITQSDDTRTISSDTAESANQELSETSTAVDAQESHTSDDTLGATDSPSKGKKTDDDEKRETGRVKWRIYKIYLQASNAPFLWTFAALCIIASGFATVGRTWTLKELSEDHSTESINMSTYTGFDDTRLFLQNPHAATIHVDRPSHHSIAFWIGLSVLFYILVILMVVGRAFFMIIIGLRASKVLFERMTHAVLRAPLRWVDTIPSGRILNRFTSDTFMVDRRLSGELGNFLQTVFSLVVVIAASLSVSMYVLIAGVLLFLFYGQIASQYITVAREVKRLNSISHSPIYDQFSSVLSGLSTIRAFRRSNFYMGRMFTLIDNSNKASWALNLSGRWMNFRMGMLGTVFVTVVAIAVSVGGVDAALAGFSLTFALRYTGRLTSLLQAMTSIELGFNAAERVVEYAEIETEPEDGKDAPAAWPTDGRIEVESLTVSYKDSLPPVLKNLNFEVKAGERIGIVGRTGAGKSTLASVFFRLLSPKEGSIRIDNIDIATLKLKDLRSRLAIIPQDPFLFSGTLRSNLDIEGLKDDYDLQTILQRVHLVEPQGADPERPSQYTPSNAVQETLISTTEVDPAASADNANAVPDLENLNTAPAATTTTEQEVNNETDSRDIFKDLSMSISTGGANLSQGQRQLVCLARSLLGRPKIVVLDEATSAVDRATDAAIQESLRAEFAAAGCTVLVIAHRLSTVADFDKILVLKAGRVAEMGTPEELLRAGMEKEKAAGSRAATEEEGAAQAADEEEEDEDGKGAFWELVQKSAEKDKLVEMILGNQEAAP